MLKNDVNINNDKTTTCEFSLSMIDKSFTGKKPPEDISVKAKFNELNDLIENIFNIIKINRVRIEYIRKIFIICLKLSALSKEIKLVNVFLKFSS
tara:strand:- start:461 stop:745 length:285 start_codon:yes stop_codon:yes gene_type:complete